MNDILNIPSPPETTDIEDTPASQSVSPDNVERLMLQSSIFNLLTQAAQNKTPIDNVVQDVVSMAIKLVGAQNGIVLYQADISRDDRTVVLSGTAAEQYNNLNIVSGIGNLGELLTDGKSAIINTIDARPDIASEIELELHRIPRNILAISLKGKDTAVGLMILTDKQNESDFTADDYAMIMPIAGTLGMLIYNQWLYDESRIEINRIETLQGVSQIINSTANTEELLQYIMDAAKTVLQCEASSLLLIDEDQQDLYFNIATGNEEIKQIRVPMGKGIAGTCAVTGERFIINDAQNDSRVYKKADETTKFITRNLLCVPMRARDKIIGVLEVLNSEGRPHFNDYDLQLFTSLANSAGVAIHNRELLNDIAERNRELRNRVHELNVLYSTIRILNQSIEVPDMLKEVTQVIAQRMEVDRVSFLFLNDKKTHLTMQAGFGISEKIQTTIHIPCDEGLCGIVMQNRKPLLIDDIGLYPHLGRYKRLRYKTKSFALIPILFQGNAIGTLCVADKKNRTAFDSNDLHILVAISQQISSSYERAVLYHEFIEKQRITRDLDITHDIQMSLLPKTFKHNEYFDIAAIAYPAREVGGDFYDVIPVDESRYAFFIADVSGKSIPAAMFMAFSRSIMRVQARNFQNPNPVLESANIFIAEDAKRGMFVTLFYMFVDPKQSLLTYGSAGHNAQLYFSAADKKSYWMEAQGRPLGISESKPFEEKTLRIHTNDVIVLCTDGVFEALNEANEEFGAQRLETVIQNHYTESAQSIVTSITDAVNEFVGNAEQHDDLTVMVIKIK